jgi:putative transposase
LRVVAGRSRAARLSQRRWRLLAFSLMENHLHLLVETPAPNLGDGIHRLHSLYAQEFNKRRGRSGHLFQRRYGAKRVTSDEQFWTVAAYIASNPVRAGLCERAEDWRWSSHAAVIGDGAPRWLDVERLLELVGIAGGDPRARYTALVDESCSALERGT